MTKIKFYSGLREIGGTVVAVETDKAVCIFDFGYAFVGRLDESVCTRKGHEVQDFMRLGILNRIDGIYESHAAGELNLKAYGETDKKYFAIISHMHIDHMGGLGCLDPKMPVYMSNDSAKLYKRMGVMGELEYREHENIQPMEYDSTITVEDIKVTCIQVDHDVIGACGFLIETEDGSICYTGDFRFHGFHPDVSSAFGNKCKGADVMITEGVTISFADVDMLSLEGPERTTSEYTLLEDMKERCRQEDGLIVINNYNRNVERIHQMIHALAKEKRQMALDSIQADYVNAFYPWDDFVVYIPEGGSTNNPSLREKKVIDRNELLTNPSKYVLQQNYKNIYELFDLKDVVSVYLHMDGAPLGDYDPSFAKFQSFLEVQGIKNEHVGLGGHAEPYYLRKMADTIAPTTLVPLHSFRPEQFNTEYAKEIVLPECGQSFYLENGKLVKE